MARFLRAALTLRAAVAMGAGSRPGRLLFGKSWNFSAFLSPPVTLDRRKIENWPAAVMLVPEFRPGQLNRQQFNSLMSLKTEMPLLAGDPAAEAPNQTPTQICWILLLV